MSTELSTRIESRINKDVSAQTGLTTTGAMNFSNVEQIMEFSKLMAIAGVAIPKHLREAPGACLAIAIQASSWEMSPFAVANKSYVVNDRIGYEAQLVNAVILRRAPIVGRFNVSYSGEGPKRRCKVTVKLNDNEGGGAVEYESPEIAKIPVQNSPLWKGDPDQQLFYYSSRAMCRRHFPDVLLGIYTPDELAEETMRDVTPEPKKPSKPRLFTKETEVTAPPLAIVETPEESPVAPESPGEERPADAGESPAGAIGEPSAANRLEEAMDADSKSFGAVKAWLAKNGLDKPSYKKPADISANKIENVLSHWEEVEV